jgi:hypothetical protein
MDELFNNNRFFLGVTSMVFNIGMRSLYDDLGTVHRHILGTRLFKLLVVYCMFFIAARDVKTALLLTLVYGLFIGFLHEKSSICILPKAIRQHIEHTSNVPSDDEFAEAEKVITSYKAAKARVTHVS